MTSAKSRWEHLQGKRSGVLDRARNAAELTIPALMPPEGSQEGYELPTPYQSLGARGVNNLASKLLLALFPAGVSFFRFRIDSDILESLGEGLSDVEEALRKLENKTLRRVEEGNLRTMVHAALKHLIVTGNAALHLPASGLARVFRLNQYTTLRDAGGTVVEAVIKETVSPRTLSDEVRTACQIEPAKNLADEEDVDVYTHIVLVEGGKQIEYHQEINELEVPDSRGRNKAEESPFIFLRWTAVENEDYGRGLVDEYMGDLRSLEGLSKSVVGFAAVAAKIILMIEPNASVDRERLIEADTGEVVTGNRDDVSFLQLDKFADFRVAKSVIDDLTLRISHAFLLQSGTVRDAERVTAAEISAVAQELEDVLGGNYTVLSRELQLPIVRREMAKMKKEGELPKFPDASIKPVIITGFDALGRGHELNKFRAFFADLVSLMGNDRAVGQFNTSKLTKRLASSHNIDIDELLKTEGEVAQDQQQAQAAQLMDKAAAPVAGAVAKAAVAQQP
tara:strand:- start:7453 stop:8976 length:1524 start_codon:yes stop_codon:yes gene_type:complete